MSVDLDSWLVAYLDSVTGSLSSFFTHARVSLAPNGASTRVRMDLSGPSQPFLHGGTLLQPSFDWPEVHGRAHGWLRLALEQAGLSWPGTMVDLNRDGLETASVTLLDERGAPLREVQVDHDWVVDQAVTPQLMASVSSMLDEALHRQHVLNQRLQGLERWALGPGVVALTIDGARVQLPAHVLGRYTANDCTLGWSWLGDDPAMGAQAQRVRDAFRTVPGAGAFRRAHVVGSRDLAQWVALYAAATLGAHGLFMPPTAPGETLLIALMALPGEKTEPLPAPTWAAQGEGPRADPTSARPQHGGTVGPLAPWAGSWLDAQALRDLQARLAGSWNPPLSAAAVQSALSWRWARRSGPSPEAAACRSAR